MGRRVSLFCWSALGAKHVGIVQSLLVTCRLHGIDPYTYLRGRARSRPQGRPRRASLPCRDSLHPRTACFTAANSVAPGGIHAKPNRTTGGNGAVTGDEVKFSVTFTTPFDLAPGHYFFVPQLELTVPADFFWLSAPRPIGPPGTPFPAGFTDLQTWTRDEFLAPDWLRVGTDIVGGTPAPTFNATFSLTGVVPEPDSLALAGAAALALALARTRRRWRA